MKLILLILLLFVCPCLWGDGTPWGWWEAGAEEGRGERGGENSEITG